MLSPVQLNATGRLRRFSARHQIYAAGDLARSFYQVQTGVVRLFTFSERQDLVHQLAFPGETFGETIVCAGIPQPYAAETLADAEVWELERGAFLELLRTTPALHWEFTQRLGTLFHHQLQRNANQALLPAADQIMWLVDYYVRRVQHRQQSAATAAQHCDICDRTTALNDGYFCVPFTRQQIADMLGLRVETVVRSVKELEKTGRLRLLDHKVLYACPENRSAHNVNRSPFTFAP